MGKRILCLVVLGSFFSALVGCARYGPRDADALNSIPSASIMAKKFPEIEISRGPGDKKVIRGKILELSGPSIKVLALPYVNETPIEIEIKDIYSVKLLDKRQLLPLDAFVGAMLGFTGGFVVKTRAIGTSGNNYYKEDYEGQRGQAWGTGIYMGLVGMGLGIVTALLQDATKTSFYSKKSESEKIRALRNIMGLRKGE